MTPFDRIELTAHRAFRNPARAKQASLWYQEAGAWTRELDAGHDLPSGTVAAFVAALSPLNGWDDQVRYTPPSLERCLARIRQGLTDPAAVAKGISGPGLGENRLRAARVLLGESPSAVLRGDKVTAFFANLTGDEHTRVTIDRHALAIAWPEAAAITPKRYREAEIAFQSVAPLFNGTPAGLQALTWVYWREVKNGRPWI
jgi:hypothetical protein